MPVEYDRRYRSEHADESERGSPSHAPWPGKRALTDGIAAPPVAVRQAQEESVRSRMEQAYGTAFGDVVIREDAHSAARAASLGTAAYQEGAEIGFAPGAFDPDSSQGMHVIAHEFAHVAQSRASDVSPYTPIGGTGHEQEANAAADAVLRGERPQVGAHRFDVAGYTPAAGGTPAKSVDQRLTELERSDKINKKKTAALLVDNEWRPKFSAEITNRELAILRISGAMDRAALGVQAAQVAQAQTDALKVQLIGAVAAVGFAAGFEWAFSAMLGQLGTTAAKIEKFIEVVENPANAAVSGAVNVAGVLNASASQNQATAAPSALSYLTDNLGKVKTLSQKIDLAFSSRAIKMKALTDEQWLTFDEKAVEASYQQLFAEVMKTKGVDALKEAEVLAKVVERHLWARWLRGQHDAEIESGRVNDQAARDSGSAGMGELQAEKSAREEPKYTVGSDIEDRLNQLGIAGLAGVTLTGHWYSSNSPGDWRKKLSAWGGSYSESFNAA